MKGTLFSADFIEDANGNLRLLEINTDTSVTNFSCFDYGDFIWLLGSNSIKKVIVIHKPILHQEMVKHLKAALEKNAPFITSFEEVREGPNVIYPTAVKDEDDTFVLRLAYDETSIFDSEYAKGKLNLLSLFYDANEKESIVEFAHKSNLGSYNSFTKDDFNPPNIPDAVSKNIVETHRMAKFYKVGSETPIENSQIRWDNFIHQISSPNVVVQKYHVNPKALEENKVESIRTYSIVYGSDLDLVHIAHYKKTAIFELPTSLPYDETTYVSKLDNKHFFEFATNYIKYDGQSEGILNTHLIIKSDDSEVEAGNLAVGDTLKSYFVNGTSLSGNDYHINNWSITGSDLPEGSYMTSSVIVYKNTKSLDNKSLSKLTVDNNEDSIFVSPIKSFLVYDSTTDTTLWKAAIDINVDTDNLINYGGSLAKVTSNELFITGDNGFSLIELDVEDTDTYIIAGTTPINSFITHNAPCFVAGTKITLANGSLKNIEDIIAGDTVATFDLTTGQVVHNVVNAVYSKNVSDVVKYKFDNGETLKCTLDHPIYVEGKGWTSFNHQLSNELYSLEEQVTQIEVGDRVKLITGTAQIVEINAFSEDVKVYNLQDIEGNHNFFANNVLVHNRFCFIAGTQITLEGGSKKNIEDIVIGDEVLSFNEASNLIEPKKVVELKQPIHSDLVKYHLSNDTTLTCTYDHPIYINGLELASYKPEWTNERYNLGREVSQIKVGDTVRLSTYGLTVIKEIEVLPEVDTQTYIFTVEDNHNFYANDILVHNK
jgi:intein/homing endonuclease